MLPTMTLDSATPFIHKRSLGQNFLTSDVVPKAMVKAAEVVASDTILEIGPGTGMLTKSLLATGATIIALEADTRAVAILNETFASAIASGKLTVIHGDARTIDCTNLGLQPLSFKVVANIPYYLSGFLLRTLLETTTQPSSITFLIQKELAQRIARDKKSSLLSLSVRAFGTPKYVQTVSRGHFRPMPKVESAILHISDISRDRFKNFTTQHFFTLLHLGLGQKRKQLLTNFSTTYPRETVENHLTALGLPITIRGEDIPLDEWCKLATLLPPQD